jgi:SMP-30/Gluconolactonase/LRE-like region
VLLEAAADEQFFNDITADGRGRLFAGSMPKNAGSAGAAGRLYLIDTDGSAAVLADDVLISNGLGADPADRLPYHVDSGRGTVWQFELDAADVGGSRQVFVCRDRRPARPCHLGLLRRPRPQHALHPHRNRRRAPEPRRRLRLQPGRCPDRPARARSAHAALLELGCL